ncbi:pyruvate formate lyase-activating protein [bacterium C-53]|nr:pyruvate formate lyase-activating protein [Lachnospiraceae bacterium]NBI04738.1 pyruvate formate lyase-activating protein [Lachnospiraceae bacterium]RKJ07810.1 pyruvate formate lyase-activating protein [bacterium C-53]
MKGYIHSIESFGTVDGPGVRFVVFFQGCPMRCKYCHNPDTWELNTGKQMDVSEILEAFERNQSFYTTGGITATGGEPMMQLDFLTELFEECKRRKIHTCLDTSGIAYNSGNRDHVAKVDRLLQSTDLVMLDIKHIDAEEHIELCKQPNDQILAFAEHLSERDVPVWIRHVVVPGITDNEEYLFRLGYFIGGLKTLKALDVLPYHTMGETKYDKLGMDYVLKGVPAMDKNKVVEKKEIILNGIRKRRDELKK